MDKSLAGHARSSAELSFYCRPIEAQNLGEGLPQIRAHRPKLLLSLF
jgi:hypothetical protein